MSAAATRLSPALKALLAAPYARGSAIPAPPKAVSTALFEKIGREAKAQGVGEPSWLVLSTAALVTSNSPAAVCDLYSHVTKPYESSGAKDVQERVARAALMRETGLKCISFSGIPRTINALGALRSHLDEEVKKGLSTQPTRNPTPENINAISARARSLWDAIYEPFAKKLLERLSDSHPDLPVHILNSHYGPNLSDPSITAAPAKVGRVLTSVVAIACLRAQQGVGPQLTSHVFGLKKSLLEGGGAEGEEAVEGQEWLTSDEGAQWVVGVVDEIAAAVHNGESSFAGSPDLKSKL